MSKAKLTTKEKELLKNLNSNDRSMVLRAIKSSKVHGSPQVFTAIIALLIDPDTDEKIEGEIVKFLHDLKSSDAIEILIKAIQDPAYTNHKASIISSFWNSPLNPNKYISVFVDQAIKGDFLIALECSTVIDTIEPPYPESEVNDSLILLKEYFSKDPEEDKTELIRDILRIIKEMEHSVNLS